MRVGSPFSRTNGILTRGAALAGAYLNIDAVWAQQGLATLLLGGGTETSVGREAISLFAGRFDSALADEKEIARTRSACALLVKELLLEDGNLCELGQTHLRQVWGVINSVSLDTSLADATLLDDPGCRLVVQVNGSTYRFEKGSNSDITLWGVGKRLFYDSPANRGISGTKHRRSGRPEAVVYRMGSRRNSYSDRKELCHFHQRGKQFAGNAVTGVNTAGGRRGLLCTCS